VAHYASDIASGGGGEEVEGGEWVAASGEEDEAFEELPATGHQGPVKDIGGDDDDEADRPSSGASGPEGTAEEAVLDISNLDLDEDDDAVAPAAAAAPVAASSAVQAAAVSQPNVVQTRTYDLIISYDKYYHVPRVWLVGYAEDRTPLTPDEIFEDVINDYYTHRDRKTVSVEDHPHRAEGGKVVSIHPCRHADVMKKLTGVVAGETADFKVDQ